MAELLNSREAYVLVTGNDGGLTAVVEALETCLSKVFLNIVSLRVQLFRLSPMSIWFYWWINTCSEEEEGAR